MQPELEIKNHNKEELSNILQSFKPMTTKERDDQHDYWTLKNHFASKKKNQVTMDVEVKSLG